MTVAYQKISDGTIVQAEITAGVDQFGNTYSGATEDTILTSLIHGEATYRYTVSPAGYEIYNGKEYQVCGTPTSPYYKDKFDNHYEIRGSGSWSSGNNPRTYTFTPVGGSNITMTISKDAGRTDKTALSPVYSNVDGWNALWTKNNHEDRFGSRYMISGDVYDCIYGMDSFYQFSFELNQATRSGYKLTGWHNTHVPPSDDKYPSAGVNRTLLLFVNLKENYESKDYAVVYKEFLKISDSQDSSGYYQTIDYTRTPYTKDGNINNKPRIDDPSKMYNVEYVAKWLQLNYTVTIGNPAHGTINAYYVNNNGERTKIDGLMSNVHYGDRIEMSYVPTGNYQFSKWTISGEYILSPEDMPSTTLIVQNDCTISVNDVGDRVVTVQIKFDDGKMTAVERERTTAYLHNKETGDYEQLEYISNYSEDFEFYRGYIPLGDYTLCLRYDMGEYGHREFELKGDLTVGVNNDVNFAYYVLSARIIDAVYVYEEDGVLKEEVVDTCEFGDGLQLLKLGNTYDNGVTVRDIGIIIVDNKGNMVFAVNKYVGVTQDYVNGNWGRVINDPSDEIPPVRFDVAPGYEFLVYEGFPESQNGQYFEVVGINEYLYGSTADGNTYYGRFDLNWTRYDKPADVIVKIWKAHANIDHVIGEGSEAPYNEVTHVDYGKGMGATIPDSVLGGKTNLGWFYDSEMTNMASPTDVLDSSALIKLGLDGTPVLEWDRTTARYIDQFSNVYTYSGGFNKTESYIFKTSDDKAYKIVYPSTYKEWNSSTSTWDDIGSLPGTYPGDYYYKDRSNAHYSYDGSTTYTKISDSSAHSSLIFGADQYGNVYVRSERYLYIESGLTELRYKLTYDANGELLEKYKWVGDSWIVSTDPLDGSYFKDGSGRHYTYNDSMPSGCSEDPMITYINGVPTDQFGNVYTLVYYHAFHEERYKIQDGHLWQYDMNPTAPGTVGNWRDLGAVGDLSNYFFEDIMRVHHPYGSVDVPFQSSYVPYFTNIKWDGSENKYYVDQFGNLFIRTDASTPVNSTLVVNGPIWIDGDDNYYDSNYKYVPSHLVAPGVIGMYVPVFTESSGIYKDQYNNEFTRSADTTDRTHYIKVISADIYVDDSNNYYSDGSKYTLVYLVLYKEFEEVALDPDSLGTIHYFKNEVATGKYNYWNRYTNGDDGEIQYRVFKIDDASCKLYAKLASNVQNITVVVQRENLNDPEHPIQVSSSAFTLSRAGASGPYSGTYPLTSIIGYSDSVTTKVNLSDWTTETFSGSGSTGITMTLERALWSEPVIVTIEYPLKTTTLTWEVGADPSIVMHEGWNYSDPNLTKTLKYGETVLLPFKVSGDPITGWTATGSTGTLISDDNHYRAYYRTENGRYILVTEVMVWNNSSWVWEEVDVPTKRYLHPFVDGKYDYTQRYVISGHSYIRIEEGGILDYTYTFSKQVVNDLIGGSQTYYYCDTFNNLWKTITPNYAYVYTDNNSYMIDLRNAISFVRTTYGVDVDVSLHMDESDVKEHYIWYRMTDSGDWEAIPSGDIPASYYYKVGNVKYHKVENKPYYYKDGEDPLVSSNWLYPVISLLSEQTNSYYGDQFGNRYDRNIFLYNLFYQNDERFLYTMGAEDPANITLIATTPTVTVDVTYNTYKNTFVGTNGYQSYTVTVDRGSTINDVPQFDVGVKGEIRMKLTGDGLTDYKFQVTVNGMETHMTGDQFTNGSVVLMNLNKDSMIAGVTYSLTSLEDKDVVMLVTIPSSQRAHIHNGDTLYLVIRTTYAMIPEGDTFDYNAMATLTVIERNSDPAVHPAIQETYVTQESRSDSAGNMLIWFISNQSSEVPVLYNAGAGIYKDQFGNEYSEYSVDKLTTSYVYDMLGSYKIVHGAGIDTWYKKVAEEWVEITNPTLIPTIYYYKYELRTITISAVDYDGLITKYVYDDAEYRITHRDSKIIYEKFVSEEWQLCENPNVYYSFDDKDYYRYERLEDGSYAPVFSEDRSLFGGDITYVARWSINHYNFTFNTDDNEAQVSATKDSSSEPLVKGSPNTVEYNSEITVTIKPAPGMTIDYEATIAASTADYPFGEPKKLSEDRGFRWSFLLTENNIEFNVRFKVISVDINFFVNGKSISPTLGEGVQVNYDGLKVTDQFGNVYVYSSSSSNYSKSESYIFKTSDNKAYKIIYGESNTYEEWNSSTSEWDVILSLPGTYPGDYYYKDKEGAHYTYDGSGTYTKVSDETKHSEIITYNYGRNIPMYSLVSFGNYGGGDIGWYSNPECTTSFTPTTSILMSETISLYTYDNYVIVLHDSDGSGAVKYTLEAWKDFRYNVSLSKYEVWYDGKWNSCDSVADYYYIYSDGEHYYYDPESSTSEIHYYRDNLAAPTKTKTVRAVDLELKDGKYYDEFDNVYSGGTLSDIEYRMIHTDPYVNIPTYSYDMMSKHKGHILVGWATKTSDELGAMNELSFVTEDKIPTNPPEPKESKFTDKKIDLYAYYLTDSTMQTTYNGTNQTSRIENDDVHRQVEIDEGNITILYSESVQFNKNEDYEADGETIFVSISHKDAGTYHMYYWVKITSPETGLIKRIVGESVVKIDTFRMYVVAPSANKMYDGNDLTVNPEQIAIRPIDVAEIPSAVSDDYTVSLMTTDGCITSITNVGSGRTSVLITFDTEHGAKSSNFTFYMIDGTLTIYSKDTSRFESRGY